MDAHPGRPSRAERPSPEVVPPEVVRSEAARPRRERDDFLDNAKYFAILLVVIGHIMELLPRGRPAHTLYLFIYMFHMPVFVVITGYFSRNFSFSRGKVRKLITNLAVPYVIFETAYTVFLWAIYGRRHFELSLLDPGYLLWFLIAVFCWRLSTPVWQQIRWPLAVAVVIALLSATTELPQQFDMGRVLGLLPFYVLGLLLRPRHLEPLKRPIARVAGLVVLAGGLGVAYFAVDHMSLGWIYWKRGNAELGVSELTGTVMRLGMFIAAIVLVFAFLAVIPRRRHWYSALGAATLYAFLLHGFFIKLADHHRWFDFDWQGTVPGILAMAGVAAVAATALSTPFTQRLTRWAIEPKMHWAFTGLRRPD